MSAKGAMVFALIIAALGATPAPALDALGGSYAGRVEVPFFGLKILPLAADGRKILRFRLRRPGTVVIRFEAQCAALDSLANRLSNVDIDIVVDGRVLPPSINSQDAFCTDNGTVFVDGHGRASMTVRASLGRGGHDLRIIAYTTNGGRATAALSFLSVVILK
jgi:hypothetical protein